MENPGQRRKRERRLNIRGGSWNYFAYAPVQFHAVVYT
jgi:hypothetical protein